MEMDLTKPLVRFKFYICYIKILTLFEIPVSVEHSVKFSDFGSLQTTEWVSYADRSNKFEIEILILPIYSLLSSKIFLVCTGRVHVTVCSSVIFQSPLNFSKIVVTVTILTQNYLKVFSVDNNFIEEKVS